MSCSLRIRWTVGKQRVCLFFTATADMGGNKVEILSYCALVDFSCICTLLEYLSLKTLPTFVHKYLHFILFPLENVKVTFVQTQILFKVIRLKFVVVVIACSEAI